MLEIRGVRKGFGRVQAVNGLDLTVEEGAIFGLIGPNGSGKTTTMRMILHILEPDEGAITWQGRPVREVATREFGYLPEERGLYPRMTVREELRFFAALRGVTGPQLEHEMELWLQRLMGAEAEKMVEALSKGNRVKVQFLAAVLHRPRLLVLDEPFSGLDPVNVQRFKEAVLDLWARGTTILFSSHRMDHVEELCTHLGLIKEGRLVLAGSRDQVLAASGRRVLRLTLAGPQEMEALIQRVPALGAGKRAGRSLEVAVTGGIDPQAILRQALEVGQVERFEVGPPSLEELYLELVGEGVPAP
ncbi:MULTISPECIES: ABC transporter ATP-binding protein [Limnochorda]|uniref:ABC transporter ATP-binding protein n=1 Tax=Limnochorda TaxID=1676651 RepID=UPI00181C2C76|nr:ATP-binding cassette domain-containing protein [Limnochorda pilosa]MBO2485505.1 sodium ABC transporter ATP-binding protein [Bacillota bacterium]MBO2518697.1 sodium ABC transporter ATP-binding protein [Bacillota bacterium]NMA71021.1 ATP-binding cassette domain-containing protein [Bacillota bacterium]